jgi:hypothetical protein
MGAKIISKRLDRFLLSKVFLNGSMRVKQWIGIGGELDHFYILMEMVATRKKQLIPFKFNSY